MLFNDHCHSLCSPDGAFSMTDMALAALHQGVGAVCFTDHCDCVNEDGALCRTFSWEAELAQFSAAQNTLGGRMKLRLGVELGEPTQSPDYAREVLALPLDFVIGSVHNPLFGRDYYFQHYDSADACRRLILDYLAQLTAVAESDFYDVIGHITYPLRYMRVRDGVGVDFDFCKEQLDALLCAVVRRGKGIELNTSGYLNCGGEPMPPRWILERYRALGGELVTIGSDAHVPENMAQGLADGMALLRAVGFRSLAVFEQRKPEMISLFQP